MKKRFWAIFIALIMVMTCVSIQLTLRVTRNSDGAVVYQDTRVGNSGNGAQFKDEFSASPNQTYTLWVDVSSVDPASSNGNYRTAWIQSFYVYTD